MSLLDEIYGQRTNPFKALKIEDVEAIMRQYQKLLQSLVRNDVLGKQCLANPAFRDVIRTARSLVDMLAHTITMYFIERNGNDAESKEIDECRRSIKPLEKMIGQLEAKIADMEAAAPIERKKELERIKVAKERESVKRRERFRKHSAGVYERTHSRLEKGWKKAHEESRKLIGILQGRVQRRNAKIMELKEQMEKDRKKYNEGIHKAWEYASRA